MSDRTLFWLGTALLALALGLLVGGVVLPPRAEAQDLPFFHFGEGRSTKYIVVTGVEGTVVRSQTVYVVDNANDVLYVFEYSSQARGAKLRYVKDIRLLSEQFIKARAKREERGGL